jgi:hypothetical protein
MNLAGQSAPRSTESFAVKGEGFDPRAGTAPFSGRRRRAVTIGALAVDDEPTLFWVGADAHQRVDHWRTTVSWHGDWSTITPASGNGSSGRIVVNETLTPVGIPAERTYFTDCLPYYFVKAGTGSKATASPRSTNPSPPPTDSPGPSCATDPTPTNSSRAPSPRKPRHSAPSSTSPVPAAVDADFPADPQAMYKSPCDDVCAAERKSCSLLSA